MWFFEENVVVYWYFLEDYYGVCCFIVEKGRNYFKGSFRIFIDFVFLN